MAHCSREYIFLPFAGFLGNVLILVALHKETSLNSPRKLLYVCLATTDLCVGVILQPGFVILLISAIQGGKDICYHILISSYVLGVITFGVSLSTLSVISADRLLALLLRLGYRQVVTLKRCCSRSGAHFRWHLVFLGPLYFPMVYLCTNNCMHSDIWILIRENLLHSSPSKSANSKPRTPRATLWMDSAERRSIQKDCFPLIIDKAVPSRLRSSVRHTYCFNS